MWCFFSISLQYSRSHLLSVEEFRNIVDTLTAWKVWVYSFIVVDYSTFLPRDCSRARLHSAALAAMRCLSTFVYCVETADYSCYGIRIGNRTQTFEWYYFQWSWVTSNRDFKITIFKFQRQTTRQRYKIGYNGRPKSYMVYRIVSFPMTVSDP